jgi:pimeloyl-ACP methyl ester carboxylesterase
VPLAKIQELVRYWGTDYDWRKAEAKLNALPQFVTNIDGLDIQFIHVRSRHPNAMPLIMTHGWPGSPLELLKVIGPLTSWAERNFHKLIYWHEVDEGGHFAAWEQPDLFAAEIRAAFRPLR